MLHTQCQSKLWVKLYNVAVKNYPLHQGITVGTGVTIEQVDKQILQV